MRIPSLKNKKIPPYLSLALLALVVFGLGLPHAAHGDWWDFVNPISLFGYLAQILAYVVQRILVLILFIESFIIDDLFVFNIVLNPMNMPAVIGAWKILRDIANSLFLLILLWLAIKIIWGFDDGGKKLLVRLIIMAFLINFSLAITGAMFGFGNALAKPFKDKMGGDVAGFIIGKTKLNTVMNVPADPQIVQPAAKCLLGELTNTEIPIICPEKTFGTSAMNAISGAGSAVANATLNNDQVKNAVGMWISNIFLILTIITFGGVGGFLIVRIAMMAFLGVLSPAAFFLYAVPGGEKLFNRWRDNLIGWTFIAPTFYFLFYLSLLVLDAMTNSPLTQVSDKIPFFANVFAMIPLVIFLIFLWATLSICKKLGAEVASAAINMGKMAAGVALTAAAGVATGGISLAGGAIARGAGGAVMSVTDKLAERPILGKLTAPITRRVGGYYQKRNEDIDKMKGDYSKIPTRQLTQQLKTTLSADKKVAMGEVLHQRGDYDKLDSGTQEKLKGYGKQLGRDEHNKARIDLITKEDVPGARDDADAKRKTLNKMTPDEKRKISKNSLNDDETKKIILETSTKADMETIIRYNADMTQQLIYGFFVQNEQMMRGIMKQETLNFIYGNMRIQTGGRGPRPAPAPATPPVVPPVTPPTTPAPPIP